MTNITYAIFDVGQTIYPFTLRPLVDYMAANTTEPKIFNNQHTPLNYDYNPYMKGRLTDEEFSRELCFFCRVPYNQNRLKEINNLLHLGCGTPFNETLTAMEILKNSGIELGILSNALPILSDTKINAIAEKYAFTSYKLGLLKPDIKIYQTLADKLHTPYKQILFIDDKEKNIIAARQLGINGIIFNKKTILSELTAFLPKNPHHLPANATHMAADLSDKNR